MSNTTKPSVIVVAPQTATVEEVSSIMISETPSTGTTTATEYASTFITITATVTTVPTDGIFISTTVETLIIVIITALVAAVVTIALQFKRVRGQKDKRENLDQLERTVIKADE